jgi:hypothetical protein
MRAQGGGECITGPGAEREARRSRPSETTAACAARLLALVRRTLRAFAHCSLRVCVRARCARALAPRKPAAAWAWADGAGAGSAPAPW